MAENGNEQTQGTGDAASMEPRAELLDFAVAGATLTTGEKIKVLQIAVRFEIPLRAEFATQVGDALLSTNIQIERELPPDLQS